jgi:tRNA threonylcarbamoyladenosine biosynthesis protein TsaB
LRILGFDTATRATTAALWDGFGLELQRRDDPPPGQRPGHAARLMPLIADQLEDAGLDWDSIDRIAVGVGPGTFTGLRIGVAVARALAQARQIPLVGISTLESLALGARRATGGEPAPDPVRAVLAVIDARRGEAFAAGWDLDGRLLLPARALTPDALAGRTAELGGGVLAVGDGAVEFRTVLERAGAQVPEDRSDLHRVAAINHCRLADGRPESLPDEIRPDYLRRPDAEIARRPGHRQ